MYQYQQQHRPSYQDIKLHCLRTGTLFEDPEFPANINSLGTGGSYRSIGNVIWKRPVELVRNPRFFSDGVSRFDVIQGKLGNCWFIAAVANLTLYQTLFEQVVARDNSFDQGQYCGAFHFRFWQYGYWLDVTVDDRLPCDRSGELLFMHSEDKREFWSALLEKAYAKIHGSYESLSGGVAGEALQDFSGGIVETIYLQEEPVDLFRVMTKAYQRQSLMTCSLQGSSAGVREERTREGLIRGHAYSITAIKDVMIQNNSYGRGPNVAQLIRIRNPWGNHCEWNGAWSDKSPEWNLVDPATKASMGFTNRSDGEFWISVGDFKQRFYKLEICHISPDPVDSDFKWYGEQWRRSIFSGSWVPGQTAGGCLNYSTFANNPQYLFTFEASAVDGDADKCTVVVSLTQKCHNRTFSRKTGVGAHCIGFRVYMVPHGFNRNQSLDINFLRKTNKNCYTSGAYIDSREISARFELLPGTYSIIPSTYEPNIAGEFLLRVFSEPPNAPVIPPQAYAYHPIQYPNPYPQTNPGPPVQHSQPAPSYQAPPIQYPYPSQQPVQQYAGPPVPIPALPTAQAQAHQSIQYPYPPPQHQAQTNSIQYPYPPPQGAPSAPPPAVPEARIQYPYPTTHSAPYPGAGAPGIPGNPNPNPGTGVGWNI